MAAPAELGSWQRVRRRWRRKEKEGEGRRRRRALVKSNKSHLAGVECEMYLTCPQATKAMSKKLLASRETRKVNSPWPRSRRAEIKNYV